MKTQKFNVPLIPFELRREETAHQIADALEFLEKVTDEIFERISTQITEERKRIDGLNRRIGVAQAKVNKLKGTNKAIKVFASPKYPAEAEVTEYKSAFSGAKKELEELKRINYRVGARHPVFDDKVLQELRQTEMVTMKLKKKDKSRQEEEGLGRLPDDLGSISSLLLFNTTENPYKKFVFVDPLGKMSKTRALAEKQEGDGLADAPQSITSREALEKRRPEDISYIPVLGYVPDISVPDFLPLVGVAGDMLYSAEQGPSIAPSALPDLPSVTGSSGSSAALPSIASPAAAAQPPPPPPPPAAAPPPPPSSTAPAPPPPPPGGPPPPPPPPPSGAPPPIKLEDAPPEVTSGGGGRSDLLAAIRNAGGVGKAKLKGVKDRKMEKKKEKEQAKVASGGDLMGSLAATLAARRQAMSGNKTKPKGDDEDSRAAPPSAANMLKMMGDMIPAPSPNAPKQDDDEEDW